MLEITKSTTVVKSWKGEEELPTRTEHRYMAGGSCKVSITAHCFELYDLTEGDTFFTYWADNKELLSAMVDYIQFCVDDVRRNVARGDDSGLAQLRLGDLNRLAGPLGVHFDADGVCHHQHSVEA